MSETVPITQNEIAEVYPKVGQIIADALDRERDEVTLQSRLIDDLKAESIDFLDILFRLERGFKVKLPQGKILADARGEIPEAEFERKGVLTELGLKRLQAYLTEVPAERFRAPMKIADIPRLFTVETFCKVVVRGLRSKAT
ncbi:MAG TPA: phosphopantetheine-binding protein [Candidatus Kryptonia bacterium]|nr:phosphopantetheine-binding protein [Candidatus Kryptonia bacterium]